MNKRFEKGMLLVVAGVGTYMVARALNDKQREFDFWGKTVLITGGSRGLGLVMARELAAKGARLALCARDMEELKIARDDLMARGAEVFIISCDVTDESDVGHMIQAVQDHYGTIDVLINNAGVIQVGPMETMTHKDYEEAMNTHFWASLYTTEAVLPQMRERRSGRIVNITSIGGKISVPHLLPYSASKFAQVGLSEGLRAELAKDGIVVTTVCPGLMRTGSHVNATFKGQNRAEYTLFSLLDAAPFSSMDAVKAARQIVAACKRGEAEIVLSPQAMVADKFHALFPGAFSSLLGLASRFLPAPGGIGTQSALGKNSQTPITTSGLTANIERAARDNGEV